MWPPAAVTKVSPAAGVGQGAERALSGGCGFPTLVPELHGILEILCSFPASVPNPQPSAGDPPPCARKRAR